CNVGSPLLHMGMTEAVVGGAGRAGDDDRSRRHGALAPRAQKGTCVMHNDDIRMLEQTSVAWICAMDKDPEVGRVIRGDASCKAYVGFLMAPYHYVRWSGPILARTAAGLRRAGRARWLSEMVDQKTEEEAPHDRWVLADLKRCGENVELIK